MNLNRLILAFLLLLSTALFGQDDFVHLIENKGQWPAQVLARTDLEAGNLYLEKDGFTYCFVDATAVSKRSHAHIGLIPRSEKPDKIHCHAVRVKFKNALSTVAVRKADQMITRYNYLLGNDQSKWVQNAGAFGTIYYEDLYQNIDLKFYSVGQNLKYDLLVNPGGNPQQIILDYQGASSVKVKNGQLVIQTSVNSWEEMNPYAYQIINGKEKEVECSYDLNDGNQLRFNLGKYDTKLPLIIDPVLKVSTYSGSVADNFGNSATFDSKGFIYGGSSNLNGPAYPTTTGAFDDTYNGGNNDIAITKYDTTGKFMVYSTIIGGNNSELPHSLIVDSKDQLIIFGSTGSDNFPVLSNAPQKTFIGGPPVDLSQGIDVNYTKGADMFVTKLNFDGSDLLGSTYLGGSGIDGLNHDPANPLFGLSYNYADQVRGEVLTDDLDHVYVVSCTRSTDIPNVSPNALQPANRGKMDGVIFKLDYSLNNILWTSYLGGSGDDAIFAIDINKDHVVVSGGTASSDLATNSTSIQPAYGGGRADGFVGLISEDGTKLKNITYWGSSAYDQIYLHEFGPDNNLYVFGQTEDATGKFYFKHTGFGQPNSGQFITKFDGNLDSTIFSLTYGNGTPKPNISPTAFLIDNCGNIYTSGWGGFVNMYAVPGAYNLCRSNAQQTFGMPVTTETDPAFRKTTDGNDFHILVLNPDGSNLLNGFYFGEVNGDDHVDGGTSRFDKKGHIYQAVCASCGGSAGFPTTPGAVSSTNNGHRGLNRTGPADGCNLAIFKIDFDPATVNSDFSWIAQACQEDTILFENRTDQGLTYTWDFGDNTPTSTANNPVHIYPTPGVYYVTLKSSNPATCNKIDSITKQVVIFPIGKHQRPDTLICLADTVQLNFPDYPGATYHWSPGRGLSDSTIANPYFYPDSVLQYRLITDGLGCFDTTIVKITVDGVLARFSRSFVYCEGQPITFTNSSINADRFLWNFGDSTVSKAINPTHTFPGPGEYTHYCLSQSGPQLS